MHPLPTGTMPPLQLDGRCEPLLLRRSAANPHNRQQIQPTTNTPDKAATVTAPHKTTDLLFSGRKHHGVGGHSHGGDTGPESMSADINDVGEIGIRASDTRAAGAHNSASRRPGASQRVCPGCGRVNSKDAGCVRSAGEYRMGQMSSAKRQRQDIISATLDGGVDSAATSGTEWPLWKGATGTHYTTLGIIVDTCMWEMFFHQHKQHQQQRQPPPHSGKTKASCAGADATAAGATAAGATAAISVSRGDDACSNKARSVLLPREARARVDGGFARCKRVLSSVYPGLSLGRAAELCAEDPRLRLREMKVCRECAVSIAETSGRRCVTGRPSRLLYVRYTITVPTLFHFVVGFSDPFASGIGVVRRLLQNSWGPRYDETS